MKPLLVYIGDSRIKKFKDSDNCNENHQFFETHIFHKSGCVLEDLINFVPVLQQEIDSNRNIVFIIAAGINNFTERVTNYYGEIEIVVDKPINRVRIWNLLNDFKKELLRVFINSIVVVATVPPIDQLGKVQPTPNKQGST